MPDFKPSSVLVTPDAGEKVLSVSSLNRLARSLLESHFPSVLVEGEISNLAMPASGHWYLSLKDKSSQIRCAMFVNRNRMVRFKPQNGTQVTIRGKLSIYEGRGDYQLIVDTMEEAGDGALQRAFEELKARLQSEGLFDSSNKQEVLHQYDHIGVVTSGTGAAVHDILSVFARRFPATRVTLFPVTVQGQEAAGEIAAAIETANRHRKKLGIQALIVGRGGGSLEDLQPFNEEVVARAIFKSELPITSAVGHEVDFTIADFVADQRAPTPSAAAELMSPSQQELFEQLAGYEFNLEQLVRAKIQHLRQSLQWLARQFKRPDRRLVEHTQTLDRLESQMVRVMQQQLVSRTNNIRQVQRTLMANAPKVRLRQANLLLESASRQLQQAMVNIIKSGQSDLAELSRSLGAISPLNTLARGYSITSDARGRVIRRSEDVMEGSQITTRLAGGSLVSTVDSVITANNEDEQD